MTPFFLFINHSAGLSLTHEHTPTDENGVSQKLAETYLKPSRFNVILWFSKYVERYDEPEETIQKDALVEMTYTKMQSRTWLQVLYIFTWLKTTENLAQSWSYFM